MGNKAKKSPYGYELILDMHDCNVDTFTRDSIESFFETICVCIDMTRCELHFWDDIGVPLDQQQTSPHTKGTSAVQFILTSSIVIHTLELTGAVYLNIFSCKTFDRHKAASFSSNWFDADRCHSRFLERV